MALFVRAATAVAVAFLSVAALPARAADPPAPDVSQRLRQLEQRLDQLQKENDALRAELEKLKSDVGAQTAPQAEAPQPAEAEDLTKIDVAQPVVEQPAPASAPTAPAEPQPAVPSDITATDVVANQPAPSGKVLNPDISVIGTFVGKVGDDNPFEDRPAMTLEESEVAFQAFVDPYAQAKFFVSITPEGAEVEEGYVNLIALPDDFTAKIGKLKASFGKVNLMHTHVRPWVDQPLVIRNFFGDEALSDSGISVSRLFPNRTGLFVEGTAEVFSGNVDGVFEQKDRNDLFYLGHLKAYRDLSESSNLEIGASYARGTTPEAGGSNEFAGLDLTWRFKPLERAIYRSFIARTELISNRREGSGDRAFGFYASADYQFAQRWFAGARIDRADHADDPSLHDRGGALTLTFWPSEFSQYRAQARRVRYGNGPDVNELLLQVQFSIGAHGAHTF